MFFTSILHLAPPFFESVFSFGRRFPPSYPESLSMSFPLLNAFQAVEQATEVLASSLSRIPVTFALEQNSPNPFNPVTTIRYAVPEPSKVTITVHDLLGKRVRTLLSNSQDGGYKSVIWDGRDESGRSVASGMYLYRISARSLESNGKFSQTHKMVLLR